METRTIFLSDKTVVSSVKKDGKMFARKTIYNDGSFGGLFEADILSRTLHPNIIGLYAVSMTSLEVFLDMELAETDLKQYIARLGSRGGRTSPTPEETDIIYGVACGLEYLHAQHIIHRDIKPANILLVKGVPKICDFDIAKVYAPDINRNLVCAEHVTLSYRAPELMCEDYYGAAIDMWSFGLCIVELVTGHTLVNGGSEEGCLEDIVARIGPLTRNQRRSPRALSSQRVSPRNAPHHSIAGLTSEWKEYVQGLLDTDPVTRLTATQAREWSLFSARVPPQGKPAMHYLNQDMKSIPDTFYSTSLKLLNQFMNAHGLYSIDYPYTTLFASTVLARYEAATGRPTTLATVRTAFTIALVVAEEKTLTPIGVYESNFDNILEMVGKLNFKLVCYT